MFGIQLLDARFILSNLLPLVNDDALELLRGLFSAAGKVSQLFFNIAGIHAVAREFVTLSLQGFDAGMQRVELNLHLTQLLTIAISICFTGDLKLVGIIKILLQCLQVRIFFLQLST